MMIHDDSFAKRLLSTLFFAVLPLLTAPLASAHDSPYPPQEEAPESLLEVDVGDAEVDLFVTGRLESSARPTFAGAVRLDAAEDRLVAYPFPGLESRPLQNTVNLTLSLRLLERYYFETLIADEFQLGSILFGYQGLPEELLQSVMVGNTSIGIDEYPYVGFGAPVEDTLGASARFDTQRSTHEFLLRIEDSGVEQRSFIGTDELVEQTIAADAYVRGRVFVLPDAGIADLELFAESPTGTLTGSDGRRYRRVDPASETRFSLADGTLTLNEAAAGAVLAFYTVDGVPVGSPGTGTNAFFLLTDGVPDPNLPADFVFDGSDVTAYLTGSADPSDDLPETALRVDVDGRSCVVLYEPGRYSPFASAALYDPGDGPAADPDAQISLTGRAAVELGDAVIPRRTAGDALITLSPRGADPRSYAARYPLSGGASGPDLRGIYGRGSVSIDPTMAAISVTRRVPTDAIILPDDVVPGSISVQRGSASAATHSLDESYQLRLNPPPGTNERITVTYRRVGAGTRADASVAIGNRVLLGTAGEATASLAARWNARAGSYSSAVGEDQGYVVASSSADLRTERLTARVAAAAGVSLADTTGALLLDGIDGAGVGLRIGATTVYPAPRPLTAPTPTGGTGSAPPASLTEANRGALRFVDYYTESSFGRRVLQPLSFTPADAKRYPYIDGGRIGPYTATAGDESVDGQAMVLDYELDTDHAWVGALIRAPASLNLSDASELAFSLHLGDDHGSVRVYLQAGSIGEDLDGDGVLDSGISATSPAFQFSCPIGELAVGHPDLTVDRPYTEDADGDRLLDREYSEQLITREITIDSSEQWHQVRLALTPQERRRLSSVSGIRVFVVRTGTAPASGVLAIADPVFLGTRFTVTTDDQTVQVVEIPEQTAGEPYLSDRFTDGLNRVLSVSWTGRSDPISLYRAVTPVPAGRYGELRLAYRLEASTAADASVAMRLYPLTADTPAHRTQPQVLLEDGLWHQLIYPLPETASVSAVELIIDGGSEGTLYLDNLSLWEPRTSVGTSATAQAAWSPDVELRLGEVSVFAAPTIDLTAQAESAGFPSAVGLGRRHIAGSAALATTILTAQLGSSVSARADDAGTALIAGHELRIPIGVLSLGERFSRGFSSAAGLQEQALDVALAVGPASAHAAWSADHGEQRLTQQWDGALGAEFAGADFHHQSDIAATLWQRAHATQLPVDYQPAGWVPGLIAVVPAPVADPTRNGRVELATTTAVRGENAPALAIGADLSGAGSYRVDESAEPWSVGAELGLALPFQIGDLSGRVAAGKKAAFRRDTRPPGDIRTDLSDAGRDLRLMRSLLALPPVGELLTAAAAEAFRASTTDSSTARYEPSFEVELTRPAESRLRSLLLPTRVSLTARRIFARAEDAVSAEQRATIDLSAVAVNLFGRLGSVTITEAFDGDEYSSALRISATRNEPSSQVDTSASGRHRARLFWSDGRALDLSAEWEVGNRRSVGVIGMYGWSTTPESIPAIERLQSWIEAGARYEHQLSAELSGEFADSGTATAIAGYDLRLLVPQRGSVGAQVRLGGGFQSLGTDTTPARLILGALSFGLNGALQL